MHIQLQPNHNGCLTRSLVLCAPATRARDINTSIIRNYSNRQIRCLVYSILQVCCNSGWQIARQAWKEWRESRFALNLRCRNNPNQPLHAKVLHTCSKLCLLKRSNIISSWIVYLHTEDKHYYNYYHCIVIQMKGNNVQCTSKWQSSINVLYQSNMLAHTLCK